MRLRHLLFLAAAACPPACTSATPAIVNLDEPAALARLQNERPDHFNTVVRILDDAQRLPPQAVPGWLRASYHAEDPVFGPALLVSYPPKRRLSFALDAVRYQATITLEMRPTAIPAR
jgi:hypothetical protein